MRVLSAIVAASILSLALSSQAQSQSQNQAKDWPAKQITLVVPFGAGGSADLLARILATHMQAAF
jgi:tripartite-type tricarboxylate transporter receptor subunit TctC